MDFYPQTYVLCSLETIRMWENVKVRSDHLFVGSSCEGVDSNQWLPFQFKLCMNINVNHTNIWTSKLES
jgi:hypothetical protein